MSYPRDLDEISTAELKEELRRRRQSAATGCCCYCGRKTWSIPDCKMIDMHRDTEGA